MKLYIAGPMTGYYDFNYPAFQEAAKELRAAGYDVINPADTKRPDTDPYEDFMREGFIKLLYCDGVALLPGWIHSTGASREVSIASIARMPVKLLTEWL